MKKMSQEDPDLMPRVFVVDGDKDEFDLDIPPLSGQEYLRRVQREARSVPAVVVAEIDTGLLKSKQTVGVSRSAILPAPQGYAASKAAQDRQAAIFSSVRQQLANYKSRIKKEGLKPSVRLPQRSDVERWCRLCFGRYQGNVAPCSTAGASPCRHDADEHGSESQDEEDSFHGDESREGRGASESRDLMDSDEATPPLLSIVAHMDQPAVMQVLEYHVNWFEATGFTPEQGRWFYALLSCIEKPLVPEASFLLRGLARNCANLRASLASPEEPILQHLNLLISLVVRYFDQRDLAENG